MHDRVQLARCIKVFGDVQLYKSKPSVAQMVGDVVHSPGGKIVKDDDLVVLLYQLIDKVRSEESSPTGYQCPHVWPSKCCSGGRSRIVREHSGGRTLRDC